MNCTVKSFALHSYFTRLDPKKFSPTMTKKWNKGDTILWETVKGEFYHLSQPFTRQIYFSILERTVEYCKAEKGMDVCAYCFMPSHVPPASTSVTLAPAGELIWPLNKLGNKNIITIT